MDIKKIEKARYGDIIGFFYEICLCHTGLFQYIWNALCLLTHVISARIKRAVIMVVSASLKLFLHALFPYCLNVP
jgi:hypothetical protein